MLATYSVKPEFDDWSSVKFKESWDPGEKSCSHRGQRFSQRTEIFVL